VSGFETLSRPLKGRFVTLEPFRPELEADAREALDLDPDAWSIMVTTAQGPGFAGWWAQALADQAAGIRVPYLVRSAADGRPLGSSSFHEIVPAHRTLEIGSTFFRPEARAGVTNPETKRLMLAAAFDAGAVRVEFKVDSVNARSQAAVLKLGAVREGVLRNHKITWTARRRDTVVFSITDAEWPDVRERLDARIAAAGRSVDGCPTPHSR